MTSNESPGWDGLTPGSPAAVERGCICPIMDNAHGRGIMYRGEALWWINTECPLHGERSNDDSADLPS